MTPLKRLHLVLKLDYWFIIEYQHNKIFKKYLMFEYGIKNQTYIFYRTEIVVF